MDEHVSFFQVDQAAGAEGMTHARAVTSAPVADKTAAVKAVAVKPVAVAPKSEEPAAAKPMPMAEPRRAAAGGARRMQANLATAIKGDAEWKEF
jgi:hypothetical protein